MCNSCHLLRLCSNYYHWNVTSQSFYIISGCLASNSDLHAYGEGSSGNVHSNWYGCYQPCMCWVAGIQYIKFETVKHSTFGWGGHSCYCRLLTSNPFIIKTLISHFRIVATVHYFKRDRSASYSLENWFANDFTHRHSIWGFDYTQKDCLIYFINNWHYMYFDRS